MAKTALEWIKGKTRYAFDDNTFEAILEERGVDDFDSPHSDLSTKQKDLIQADLIFTAVMLSPISTSSRSISHAGFSESVGSETSAYSSDRINFALSIYKMYGDSRYDYFSDSGKISRIPFRDII